MKRHIGFYRRRLAGLLCILSLLAATVLPAGAKETAVPAPEPEVMNILLIGRDAPAGTDHSRSDSILLCTFHADSNTLTMTSVLRDLYVPIPGHRSNRINAAYALGGTKLLKQTVEANFGVAADGSITVDFTRFPKLIDLLGGVTLELRADEAAAINDSIAGNLTEGENLLTGAQALAYVRIRKLDKGGDFSRTNRQQKLLTALLDAYRSASLPQILRLLKETLSIVETDMDTGEILRSARQLVPILSRLQVKHQHIPAEGTYEYRTVRGMSVLSADLEAARNLLQQTVNPPAEKTDAPAIRLLCFQKPPLKQIFRKNIRCSTHTELTNYVNRSIMNTFTKKVVYRLELTRSEMEIMDVMWESKVPMSRADLLAHSEEKTWKDSSVHILLNGLLQKGAIQEAGLVKRSKTYGRVFIPTMTREEYFAGTIFSHRHKPDIVGLFAALLRREDITPEELARIKEMVAEK